MSIGPITDIDVAEAGRRPETALARESEQTLIPPKTARANCGARTGPSAALLVIIALIAVTAAFAALETLVKRYFPQIAFDDAFRRAIAAEKPDIVLIGNSTLGNNINKNLLASELSRRAGRPINPFFVGRGSAHSAWLYLALKNQVASSGIKDIPVVIMEYEDFFLRGFSLTAGDKTERLIRQTMLDDEPELKTKIGPGNSIYLATGFPYLFSQRYILKRHVVASLIVPLLRWSGATAPFAKSPKFRNKAAEEALSFILGRVFTSSQFRNGQSAPAAPASVFRAGMTDADFAAWADLSFLPLILNFSDRFKIVFALSNSSPALQPYKTEYLKPFSETLERYLNARGSLLIDMNRRPELQKEGLMHDSRHFNPGEAITLNTSLFAEELINQGVLSPN